MPGGATGTLGGGHEGGVEGAGHGRGNLAGVGKPCGRIHNANGSLRDGRSVFETLAVPAANAVVQLPLMRYRLRFHVGDAEALRGIYLGSAWRGAFGRALRRSACITNLPSCENCVLLERCVYPRTFEKRPPANEQKLRRYPTAPNPYVLAPHSDSADGTLGLDVTLFGDANDDAPAILQALERAGRDGLTQNRVPLRLLETQAETTTGSEDSEWTAIRSAGGGLRTCAARIVETPRPVAPPSAVRVRLTSPLRIRADGRYVDPRRFGFRAFAANLLRRVSLLTYFFGKRPLEVEFATLLQEAERVRIEDAQLRWREGARHSSRQQARIPMGGIVGSFVAQGPAVATLWPCLWLGQWTHIGKGCTMGLGGYALEPADGADRWTGQTEL